MRIAVFLLAAAAILGPVAAQCSTFANTPSGTDLQLDDDDLRTVGLGFPFAFNGVNYTSITVCSNGFVWLGDVDIDDYDGLAADFFDNEADLLAFGPRIAVCWDDWDPSTAGTVEFHTDGTNSASVVWKGVPHFGVVPGTLNAELVLAATGEFFLHYEPTMVAPGSTCIVGSSAGGGVGTNALDWTTALPGVIPGCTGYQLFVAGAFSMPVATLQQIPTAPAGIDHTAQGGTLLTCTPGTYPPLAADAIAFGVGCPAQVLTNASAIYEVFTPTGGANPTDLSGLSITFVKTGTTYVSIPGPGLDTSYLTSGVPTTQFDETIVPGLSVGPMGEFPFSGAGFATIDAAANGYLVLEPGAFSDFSPTAAEFLAEEFRIAPHWTDYDFTASGTFYWQNNDPNFCMATWENVEMYAQPGTSNTFQCKLWANGDITFSYGAVASAFDDVVVGFTLGHGATDPGASDLSAAIGTPIVRDIGQLTLPLVHTASGRASIYQTLTLRAFNLNGGSLGVFVVGGTATNIDLTSLGMPGCTSYATADSLFFLFASSGVLTLGLPIPGTPALVGVTGHTQAAVFTPVNPFGLITSNRLTFTVGL